MVLVEEVGWNYKHPNDRLCVNYSDNRENRYLLVLYHSPTIVVLNNKEHKVDYHACILYDNHAPRFYYPAEATTYPNGLWTNDYILFSDSDIRSFVEDINIPFNTIIPVSSPDLLSNKIKELAEEMVAGGNSTIDNYKKDLKLKSILLHVAETITPEDENSNQLNLNIAIIHNIKKMRTHVMENIHMNWTVEKMAKYAMVSSSYLHKVYKQIFGVTPNQDINRRRLEKAKYYLGCTDLLVKEVAYKVGYKNEYYFIRFFTKQTGMTPGRYAKCRQRKETSNILYINERPLPND